MSIIEKTRNTNETQVFVSINPYGSGTFEISTPIKFFRMKCQEKYSYRIPKILDRQESGGVMSEPGCLRSSPAVECQAMTPRV